jgi:hypothetical protein
MFVRLFEFIGVTILGLNSRLSVLGVEYSRRILTVVNLLHTLVRAHKRLERIEAFDVSTKWYLWRESNTRHTV